MRLRTAAALAATSALTAGAAALAAGRYAADAALRTAAPPQGGGPSALPPGFGGPPLTVHAAGTEHITVTRSPAALLPGTYGLTAPGLHAVVGPVLDETKEQHGPDTVTRRLERVTRGSLSPGSRVWLTPHVYARDPAGTDVEGELPEHREVEVPGELGPLPAWYTPGFRDTWIIALHGLGSTRDQPLALAPFYARLRFPVLSLGYRGDPGGPGPAGRTPYLGDSEWRDVRAAVRHALDEGAERVILHGWSTGATTALRTAAELSPRGGEVPEGSTVGSVGGLVLDSPVLDWHRTLRALLADRGLPRVLHPLAVRAAQGRGEVPTRRLAAAADPAELDVPTLLVHGPDDAVAPFASSRAFAEARDDLVTLHPVPRAPHAAMWNADPEGYEETLRRFLTPLM